MTAPKQASDLLVEAQLLFGENGENWIQNTERSWRVKGGREHVDTYCSIGAIRAVVGRFDNPQWCAPVQKAINLLTKEMGSSIPNYNDNHSWPEVKAAFCRATKRALDEEEADDARAARHAAPSCHINPLTGTVVCD